VLLVVETLIWSMVTIWKYSKWRWVAIVNVPYLLWGVFASVLQLTITTLNW